MLLYKYRSLKEWNFVLDILAHKRLYAASFLDLNDPMEGYYRYATDVRTSTAYERYDREIRAAKAEWRICSLSEEPRSTLMWSYYAGGHKGLVIGVERPAPCAERCVRKVFYDNTLTLSGTGDSPDDAAVRILSQKLYSWAHEAEHRVFSKTKTPFIPVKVKELLIGCRATKDDEELIRSVAEPLIPDVEIRKLKKSELIADYGPKE